MVLCCYQWRDHIFYDTTLLQLKTYLQHLLVTAELLFNIFIGNICKWEKEGLKHLAME